MGVIFPGLQAEVDRRRELLLHSGARRPPRGARSPGGLRRRVGWAMVRTGLVLATSRR